MDKIDLAVLILAIALIAYGSIGRAEEVECSEDFWGICVLEVRQDKEDAEDLRRWWECVRLGPSVTDTAHQDRCTEKVYGKRGKHE